MHITFWLSAILRVFYIALVLLLLAFPHENMAVNAIKGRRLLYSNGHRRGMQYV